MSPASDPRLGLLAASRRVPALVVVDVQRDFAEPDRIAAYSPDDDAMAAVESAVAHTAALVARARETGVRVVWVELGSDPAHPWGSSNWLRGGDLAGAMPDDEPCRIGTEGAQWYGLGPAHDEIRVVKSHYSGFLGTDLADRLTGVGAEWLTVVGLTSECCVAATAEDAMQLGWPVVVASDATAAYDLDVNDAALRALELNVGVVCPSSDVVDAWERVAG